MYLKAAGLAHEDASKKKRRKWVRYERKHSLSAGHIDGHELSWSDLNVCLIIDDASRTILAGREFRMLMTGIISSLDVVKATSIPRTVNWLWINLWKSTGGSVP